MKKIIIAVVLLSLSVVSFSQSEKYIAAMKKNLAAMDTSFKNPANLLTWQIALSVLPQQKKTNGWLIIMQHFARLIMVLWSRIKTK